jgi:transglutaminase-like putative cysteine protease
VKAKPNRWWNLLTAILLIAALFTVVARLEATDWTEHLNTIKWLVMIGFLLGLGLGYSDFKPKTIRWLAFFYTVTILPLHLTTIFEADIPMLEKYLSMGGRIGVSLKQFFTNAPVQDPILFLLSMALIFWFISLIAGYTFTRNGKPWVAVIASAVVIVLIEYFNPPISAGGWYSGSYTVIILLLLVKINFLQSTKQWEENGTLVEFETGFNLSKAALIIGIILVFFSWNISSVAAAFIPGTSEQAKVIQSWQKIRNGLSNLVAPLSGPVLLNQELYGDEVKLGTGAILGEEKVFVITADQRRPTNTRFYWRARTYDEYSENRWRSTISAETAYSPQQNDLQYPVTENSVQIEFKFEPQVNLGVLYTPTYPYHLSRPGTIISEVLPNNSHDISTIFPTPGIRSGESYTVNAFILLPTVAALKAAPADYPAWISEKYLQLPEDFSPNIDKLAKLITQDQITQYDKVNAITNYLRREITYQDQIPAPPEDVDPIEWFLFDYKAGFCNYYASAEVLMLRSLGIPARMVFGYAQGTADETEKQFTVERRQAHAWPEIYFSGIGWVEFEPTSALPVIQRLSGVPNDENSASFNSSGEGQALGLGPIDRAEMENLLAEELFQNQGESAYRPLIRRFMPWIIGIGFADFIGLILVRRKRLGKTIAIPTLLENSMQKRGIKVPAWLRQWTYFTELPPVEKSFSRVYWSLKLLKAPINQAKTPAELVENLINILPEQKENANILLNEYQKALFSPYPADTKLAQRAGTTIFRNAIKYRIKKLVISGETEVRTSRNAGF